MNWNAVVGLVLVIAALVLTALNYSGNELGAALVLVVAGIFFLSFPGKANP